MTTVPKSDTPPPANNAKITIVSDSMSGNYGRPASGGDPVAGRQEGNPPSNPPAGSFPGPDAYMPQPYRGNVPGTSGTLVGPDMGSGATIVVPDSGNMPSGGDIQPPSGGTVGDSGDQGAPPGSPGFSDTGWQE